MSDDEAKPEVFTEPPTETTPDNEVLPAPVETETTVPTASGIALYHHIFIK